MFRPVRRRPRPVALSIPRAPREEYLTPRLNDQKKPDCIGFLHDIVTATEEGEDQ